MHCILLIANKGEITHSFSAYLTWLLSAAVTVWAPLKQEEHPPPIQHVKRVTGRLSHIRTRDGAL